MADEVQGQAAETAEDSESSEATIAVHWREEGYYPPPVKFIGQANASDPAILERFAEENIRTVPTEDEALGFFEKMAAEQWAERYPGRS